MAIFQGAVVRAGRLVPPVDRFDSTLAIATTAILHCLVVLIVLFFSRVALERNSMNFSAARGANSESEFRLRFVTASSPDAKIGAPKELALVLPEEAAESDAAQYSLSESAEAHRNALTVTSTPPDSGISEADMADLEHNAELRRIYLAELRAAILKQWNRPEISITTCSIELQLRPGGQVAGAKLGRCSLVADARNQLEAAALLAQPLPYRGYETVFSELVELHLEP